MRAAVLTAHNAPLLVCDVEACPLQFGQVRVRVLASGICGAQLQEIRGEKGGPLPHLLGHEGCGVVEAVGVCVTRVKVGDKVVMHWRKAAGIESDFPRYRLRSYVVGESDREFTSGKVTTFSEVAVCSENRLTPVPQDTPVELCALLGCGLSTALGTVENDANLRFGERVLIIGCGGLGTNLIRAAKLRGAWVCVADVHASKVGLAHESGCDLFVALREKPDREWLDRQKFDVVIDTAGGSDSMTLALQHLAPSGRYVMVGQPAPGEAVWLMGARHMFEGDGKVIRATQGGSFKPDEDIPRYIALWRSGALDLSKMITHRIGLEDINEGIALVKGGYAGRVLIEM